MWRQHLGKQAVTRRGIFAWALVRCDIFDGCAVAVSCALGDGSGVTVANSHGDGALGATGRLTRHHALRAGGHCWTACVRLALFCSTETQWAAKEGQEAGGLAMSGERSRRLGDDDLLPATLPLRSGASQPAQRCKKKNSWHGIA